MTKNEIKTLIQDIARDQAEDDTIDDYYDEAVIELAQLLDPPIVEAELLAVTAGTATYEYPANAVELLQVFIGTNPILRTDKSSLESHSKSWRGDSGTSIAFKTDHEDEGKFRLYPNPDTTSTALGIGATEPLGDDFPANMGAVIYSDSRETGISDMLGLYITFRVLYKEFARPSNHQDMEWALLHKKIAQLFFYMGVMRDDTRTERKKATTT
jgi:hypothetical protein